MRVEIGGDKRRAGLQVIGVSNPAAPVRVGGYKPNGLACDVGISGRYAYLPYQICTPWECYEVSLAVIDVSNPTAPVYKGGWITAQMWSVFAVAVSGGYAYVANWSSGLQVIDVSNPRLPQHILTYRTGNYPQAAAVAGSL